MTAKIIASTIWMGKRLPTYPIIETDSGKLDSTPTLQPPRKQPILPSTNPPNKPTEAKSATCQKLIFLTRLTKKYKVNPPPSNPPQKDKPGYLVRSEILIVSSIKIDKLKSTNKILAPINPPKKVSKQISNTFSSSRSQALANLQAKKVE